MKKVLFTVATLAALSSSAFAQTVPAANPGQITFQGEIVAGACGISADALDQTVSLGQVPANAFKKLGDRSPAQSFNIALTDCDTTTAKNAFFTFTGTTDLANNELFATTGNASGVGIRLESGSEYLVNGTEQKAGAILQNGNNSIPFAAMYESTGTTVTPGPADSVANFTVRYQ
jgi:major type 1 subunit fimbrin (pilin)